MPLAYSSCCGTLRAVETLAPLHDASGGKFFDEPHRSAAMRAGPERLSFRCWQGRGSGRRTQQLLAYRQQRLTFAIGEEAKISDADETSGQYMLDKAAEELRRRQSHFAVL